MSARLRKGFRPARDSMPRDFSGDDMLCKDAALQSFGTDPGPNPTLQEVGQGRGLSQVQVRAGTVTREMDDLQSERPEVGEVRQRDRAGRPRPDARRRHPHAVRLLKRRLARRQRPARPQRQRGLLWQHVGDVLSARTCLLTKALPVPELASGAALADATHARAHHPDMILRTLHSDRKVIWVMHRTSSNHAHAHLSSCHFVAIDKPLLCDSTALQRRTTTADTASHGRKLDGSACKAETDLVVRVEADAAERRARGEEPLLLLLGRGLLELQAHRHACAHQHVANCPSRLSSCCMVTSCCVCSPKVSV